MSVQAGVFFDRRVSDSVLELFTESGPFRSLVDLALSDRSVLDLQLRRKTLSTTTAGESWVSLYAGLSSVVTINFNSMGALVDTHPTYRDFPTYRPWWRTRQPVEVLGAQIDAIVEFARATIDYVRMNGQFFNAEGRVHCALASCSHDGFRLVNREVSPAFRSLSERTVWMTPVQTRLKVALDAHGVAEPWWPSSDRLGTGCDFLGVNDEGDLLTIEVRCTT